MGRPKSKNSEGLGNALMKDLLGKGKGADRRRGNAITRINHATGEEYVTKEREEARYNGLVSVTEQSDLNEFISTAQMADTDFAAEKMYSTTIVQSEQRNPYLLSVKEEQAMLRKHKDNKRRLTVPRRPQWDSSTTKNELERRENANFLEWRRGIAELEETKDLLMTPFERNIEVWKQLWRVIERADLVVQIVDARNPLLYRCIDLENYVKEVDPKKKNLLLLNKADMLTDYQRKLWAQYLRKAKIPYKFFSAHLAKERNELRDLDEENARKVEELRAEQPNEPEEEEDDDEDAAGGARIDTDDKDQDDSESNRAQADSEDGTGNDHEEEPLSDDELDTRILTVEELEYLFLQQAPDSSRRMEIGLVGYPNVGKSSTINALIGAKKVSVSSTPGKTKHFQTTILSDRVMLCDCPGLVFPNFASTKGDLVCNGVLPIDQMREYTAPATLVAQRIPLPYLEAIYGIHIRLRPREDGGTGVPSGEDLLRAYARARGYMRTGIGQPDESRAARYVLKDYVNGKLLYCEPPPGISVTPAEFNEEHYDVASLPEKRRINAAKEAAAAGASAADNESLASASFFSDMAAGRLAQTTATKSDQLDKEFVRTMRGHMKMPFSYQYTEQGQQMSLRKSRQVALANGVDPQDMQMTGGKQHFKGKKSKARKTRAKDTDDY